MQHVHRLDARRQQQGLGRGGRSQDVGGESPAGRAPRDGGRGGRVHDPLGQRAQRGRFHHAHGQPDALRDQSGLGRHAVRVVGGVGQRPLFEADQVGEQEQQDLVACPAGRAPVGRGGPGQQGERGVAGVVVAAVVLVQDDVEEPAQERRSVLRTDAVPCLRAVLSTAAGHGLGAAGERRADLVEPGEQVVGQEVLAHGPQVREEHVVGERGRFGGLRPGPEVVQDGGDAGRRDRGRGRGEGRRGGFDGTHREIHNAVIEGAFITRCRGIRSNMEGSPHLGDDRRSGLRDD